MLPVCVKLRDFSKFASFIVIRSINFKKYEVQKLMLKTNFSHMFPWLLFVLARPPSSTDCGTCLFIISDDLLFILQCHLPDAHCKLSEMVI